MLSEECPCLNSSQSTRHTRKPPSVVSRYHYLHALVSSSHAASTSSPSQPPQSSARSHRFTTTGYPIRAHTSRRLETSNLPPPSITCAKADNRKDNDHSRRYHP